ncbi:MAG: hypothetical protein MI867_23160, partial [Pseudomonadales bacterium]|nr:hypothetical protein [Pseudomonadales bacterium]
MSFFYGLLVAAFGGTVGALSALTISSTTNTIIEVAAGILIGGGGVLALVGIKNAQAVRLVEVGKLGCLFLLFFWMSWAGTKIFLERASNPWADTTDPEIAAMIWETEALAKSLGVGFRTYRPSIDSALANVSGSRPHWCGMEPALWIRRMDGFLEYAKTCATGEDRTHLESLALDMRLAKGDLPSGKLSKEDASELYRLFWTRFSESAGMTSAADGSCTEPGDLSSHQKI